MIVSAASSPELSPSTPVAESAWERFELLGEISRGGMGIVYKAFDHQTLAPAAIKMVRVADKRLIQSIRREIHTLVRVSHPGIVGILAEGLRDGMPWYAMEYVEALTLLEYCSSAPLTRPNDCSTLPLGGRAAPADSALTRSAPVDRRKARQWLPADDYCRSRLPEPERRKILTLVRRICSPLSYIHGEGLVHLDLKPNNILVRPCGQPVILDFGLATIVRSQFGRDALGALNAGFGTVHYMAPEQINGALVDARTDMYALGCILYQLLTGRVPFAGPTSADTIYGHLSSSPAPPSSWVDGICPALDELVLRLLEKDPRARIGYAHDLAWALERLGAQGWEGPLPKSRAYVYRPRMAGRAIELETLVSLFGSAERGPTRIVLVGGESGVGKTRLAAEFAQAAVSAAEDTEVLVGEFRAQGGPLHGFKRILVGIADACRGLSLAECARILGRRATTLARYEPEFQWFVHPGAVVPELLPDAARQLLFQDLFAVLRALGELYPILLVLDDIQWADELSLGFLEFVRTQAETAPLRGLILATYRTEEPSRLVEEFAARPGIVAMKLGRLELAAVGALIADMLALPHVAPAVVNGLFRHSEGNPLFLTEYLLESVAADLLWRDADGVWHACDGAGRQLDYTRLALPSTVNELIVHRLASLSQDARRLAEIAAVLSPELDMEVLSLGFAASDSAFFDALDELRHRHVLGHQSARRLAFEHGKIREAVYAQIEPAHRAQLHALLARTLAALPQSHAARVPATIADHFYAGAEDTAALPYALLAGDEARWLYGQTQAERFYVRSIATLNQSGDDETATRTLMKLALVYMGAFETRKARRVYARAFRHWERLRLRNPAAARTAVLTVATGEPPSLDPGRTYDTDSAFLQRQLFAGLVEVDEEANVLPAVATRWRVSADGKTYTFYLRADARWSDGTPMHAQHFEYAWKRNLSPALGSLAATLLDVLEHAREYRQGRGDVEQVGVRARGDHELEVRLAAPSSYLLQLLAHPIAAPQPPWLIAAKGDAWASPDCIVTNGAFKVVRWVHGQQFNMEHNPYDVSWSRGNVRELRCRLFSDYRDAIQAYAQEEVDMLDMAAASAERIAALRLEYSAEFELVPSQSISYLVFRADRPPFDDPRVRHALAHAIDRSQLTSAALQLGNQPATGGFVPPGIPGHSPELMLSYQPELARALLAAAGCTAADFAAVRWLYTHGIVDPVILHAIRDSWRSALGIDILPQVLRWQEYQSGLDAGVPDVIIGTWTADFADPDNFLRSVFHSTMGLNEPRWQSPEFDALVDRAARGTDQAERMSFYRAADRLLVCKEAVIVPLCYGREPVLVKSTVASFPRTASWLRHLKNCWVRKPST